MKAAVLLIGDELLSGRTQDVNLQTIAKFLQPLGVQVAEARVVSDAPAAITAAVRALSGAYDYVFTTGGIGPTHDDKTADAVAAAFGRPIDVRADARAILEAHYGEAGINEARLRMARIPEGAILIANPVSKAPGFQLENVFVLAGVPSVMRGMLQDLPGRIRGGAVVRSVTVRGVGLKEGDIATDLAAIESEAGGELSVGSYPFYAAEGFGVAMVARGTDPARLAAAADALTALAARFGVTAERSEGD